MRTENSFESLSDDAFAHLGKDNVAYIKAVQIGDGIYFVLTSAAGQEIVVADNPTTAQVAADERGLVVLTMH